MSLREFIGSDGRRWKAWDVTAEQIHPKTRAEDYMRDLAEGWIVFERVDGEEKRRLCPYPIDWDAWPDEELAALCDRAERVKRRATPAFGIRVQEDTEVPHTPSRGADIWTGREGRTGEQPRPAGGDRPRSD
ncbi:MAG TPA: hypothetical protein VHM30_13500 [Gemmatimonadaceae bacterium]|nr:hypothetical protein [Gemmatimonadaceae bacterium]